MQRKIINFFQKYGIEHLTLYLIGLSAIVTLIAHMNQSPIGVITPDILASDRWWYIFFFPFRLPGSYIVIFITLYLLWMFGSAVEFHMGKAYFNMYILSGFVLHMIAVFIFPGQINIDYFYLTLIFAMAVIHPDTQLYIAFIIPVRIKWIALTAAALLIYDAVSTSLELNSPLPLVGLGLSFASFLIFFGKSLFQAITSSAAPVRAVRKVQFAAKVTPGYKTTVHSCHICQRTEADDPKLEFRYCSKCNDIEYCMDHLYNHEHIQEKSVE